MPKAPKQPKKARASKPLGGITRPALGVLRRIADGEVLTAVRTFPHPFHFKLGPLSREHDPDAKGILPSHASALIDEGLVQPLHASPLDDFLVYELTEKGRRLAAEGLPADDGSQLDWTKEVA
jgi:hypothetical protein